MNTFETYQQVRREAGRTALLLVLLIVFWLLAGFGLYALFPKVALCHIPLWAIFGSLGVWLFAVLGVRVLLCGFKDMELKEARDD